LDYPLVPEAPYPAAIHAICRAYIALQEHVHPARVALAGDSAGGGLVLSVLLALRDVGAPLPAAAVCLSPWTDRMKRDEGESTLDERDPVVRSIDLARMSGWYLGGADPADPLVSPVVADLAGLPPLLIHV
jgi:acetyl esterase/lipase